MPWFFLVPTMGNFTPKRHLLNHPQTKPSQIRVEEKNGKRSCPQTRWNYLNFKAWKFQFGGGGWKRNPIFLWTDIFNLMAQSLRILLCALCSLFFVAAFLHLQANLALYKLLSQIEIYIYFFFNCQSRLGGSTTSTLETSLANVHTLLYADMYFLRTLYFCVQL